MSVGCIPPSKILLIIFDVKLHMARFVSHLNPVGGWVHLRPTFSARFDRGLAVYKKIMTPSLTLPLFGEMNLTKIIIVLFPTQARAK